MFEEDLYLMNKKVQSHPTGGTSIVWSRGVAFRAKLQLDNSVSMQVAQAQGVKISGYLALEVNKITGNPIIPISINDYIEFEKVKLYVRVVDTGVIESGIGIFNERQYSVEAVATLPR